MSTHHGPDASSREIGSSEPQWSGFDLGSLAAAFLVVVLTGARNGSYFSTSWGLEALAFLGIGITGLISMTKLRMGLWQAAFLATLTAFVAWVGLSAFWSESVPGSVRELERDVIYVALAFALGVFGRYLTTRGLVLGVLAGIVGLSGYALATRIYPTHFAPPDPTFDYQLAVPLGYWNALGLLCAIGVVLAVGVASQDPARLVRMLAGAATCIIAPAMLFTFSRGAWVAAVVGFVAMISLDSRRVRLVATLGATAIPVTILVGLGVTSAGLTDLHATMAQEARDGRPYGLAVVVLGVAAAVLVELVHAALVRLDPGARAERRLAIGAAIVAILVVVAALAAAGGPVRAAERSRSALSVAYTGKPENLRDRFVSFASNGRIALWRVTLRDAQDHPLVGTGAGTYEETWYRLRSDDSTVRDAHSMYLEVLAELGPFGLLLLLLALTLPAVRLVRSRSQLHVPGAAGAFAAYVLHAGFDWDWEVVCLTTIAILLGTTGMLPLGEHARAIVLGRNARVGLVAVGAAAAIFAFVSYAGNRELAASRRSLTQGNPTVAADDARRASRLLRWSVEPWVALGDAQRSGGDLAGARSSYARAAGKDPGNWRVWVALADVTYGAAHRQALREVRALNPRYDPASGGS